MSSVSSSSDPPSVHVPGPLSVTCAACGAGLTAAVVSALVTLTRMDEPPQGWSGILGLASVLAAGSLIACGLIALLWYGLLRPSRRASFASLTGLAAGVGVGFAAIDLFGAFDYTDSRFRPLHLLSAVMIGLGLGWILARRVRKLGWVSAPVTLAGLPISLLAGFLWHWSRVFEKPLATSVIGIAALAAMLWWINRHRLVRQAATVLASLQVLVALAGVGGVLARSPTRWAKAAVQPAISGSGETASPRSIILITIDTLRRDALSLYNPETRRTPHIDALGKDSLVFDYAYSTAPWTLPSLTSIMTGLPVEAHGQATMQARDLGTLPTLALSLLEGGYYTAAIGVNSFLAPAWGLDRGFLEYTYYPQPKIGYGLGPYALRSLFPERFRYLMDARELTDMAIEWLENRPDGPSFLWLHYFDPHAPYAPPERFLLDTDGETSFNPYMVDLANTVTPKARRERVHELYLGEVQHVDDQIGRLVASLEELGVYDEALVVFSSDHGEEFWDHGDTQHGHAVHEELIAVPLLVKLPDGGASGRVPGRFTNGDLAPALLSLAGIDPGSCLSSPTLLEVIAEGRREETKPIISGATIYDDFQTAVIFDDYKYIRFEELGIEQLFNLADDPGERRRLEFERPDLVERARALYREHEGRSERLRSCLGRSIPQEEGLSPEQIERLKSLGYL